MDLATLNENSNNNNHLSTPQNLSDSDSLIPPPADASLSWWDCESEKKEVSPPLVSKLCLNRSPLEIPSASSFPLTQTSCDGLVSSARLLHPCGPLCECANCAASPSTTKQTEDSAHLAKSEDRGPLLEVKTESEKNQREDASEALPVLMRMDLGEETPAMACYIGQQQETLVQLRRSGLVRRRAERLERLSGLSQDDLQSLKPLHACQMSKKSSFHAEEAEELSCFTGDFPKSSTPCQVRLEPLVVPLTNEALLGVVGSGLLTPTSSPHGSTLTRSSSSDSLRSVRGKPGLVRQRAQEIETRMRLAGLTVPSRLKRSNSLAKLGSLNFSSEDLCSACSSDAGTLLLLSLSPEPDPGLDWDSPTTPAQPRPCKDLHTPERALPYEPRS